VNEATFEQCRGCPDYEVARQNPQERFVDDLTGLYRREYFDATLEEEVRRARSEGWALALLLADIDHFKRVNDTYGHLQGDRVLREMGEITQAMAGERGVACRYGGEEIALILPRMEKKDAQACGEELRRTVELHTFERTDRKGEVLPMTLSVGISLFPSLARDPVELIRQADQALYRAKETGRNRVTLYDSKKDTEEVPKILAVTFTGFPEISNSGKISLERWRLKEAGILEELVALDVFDHQRGVRSISEESKPGEAGAFTQPIEGTAKEIVRQGSLTRFRLALRSKAFQDLERAVRRTGKKRKQDSPLSPD
jgi:diguanylate cyclase (GGDEF)-like protein